MDDLLIIFDQRKTNEYTTHIIIINTDEHLEFKIFREEYKTTNYLDPSINRNHNNVDLSIYRKPTYIDVTIHFSSNHPYDEKLAGFHYVNRMITMPIIEQAAKREWNTILIMAQNNGFREHLIHRLRNKLIAEKDRITLTQTKQYYGRKWATFTYHSPSIYKVTNLFKGTKLKIDFRPTNIVYQQLSQKPKDSNISLNVMCNNRSVR